MVGSRLGTPFLGRDVLCGNMHRSYTSTIRRLVSPVFLSEAADGTVVRGLSGIPDDRPMLFVGNHQTFALDLGIFMEQILREKRMLLRGLAHPAIFSVRSRPLSLQMPVP